MCCINIISKILAVKLTDNVKTDNVKKIKTYYHKIKTTSDFNKMFSDGDMIMITTIFLHINHAINR